MNTRLNIDAILDGSIPLSKLAEKVSSSEPYILDTNNYKTSEDYNNLKAAVESNKIIIVYIENTSIIASALLDTNQIVLSFHVAIPLEKHGLQVNTCLGEFKSDGIFTINNLSANFITDSDGTKFLSDDGTYKEINLDSKPAYHNICLDNYSDNIMSSDDFNELSLAIENQVPIIILLTGGNFIGSSACDATMDPGGNITLFYTIMSIEGDLRYFRTLILSNDLSITIEELFNSSKINLAIQPEDLATTTTPGLMSAEDKTKLDQVTAANTSIVTQAEYDALVSAGAATSGTVYYIRG